MKERLGFFKNKINKLCKNDGFLSPEKLFVRVLSSWLISCIIVAGKSSEVMTQKDFLTSESPALVILLTAIVFAALNTAFFIIYKTKLLKIEFESILLLLCSLLYFSFCLIYDNDVYFAMALCLIASLLCVYMLSKNEQHFTGDIGKKGQRRLMVLFLTVSFAVIAAIGVFKCLTFSSPNYDLGIFTNTAYNLKTKFIQYNTCERDSLITHFQVHISPVLYLVTPFYALFPSAITLQVIQAVLLSSSVIPVYLICKNRFTSNKLTVAVCFAFLFFPALTTGTFYDFHENAFLTPLILWMLYFYEKKKYVPMFLFAILTLTVKEDASVYVACFGIYLFTQKGERKKGALLTVISVCYLFVCVFLINKYGFGAMVGRFKDYITDERLGMISIIANVILDPVYVIKNSVSAEKLAFIIQAMCPVLFLPMITKKYSRFILLCPFVLINLMSSYQYQASIFFQYIYGNVALIFYLSIINLNDMSAKTKRNVVSCCLCVTTLFYCAFVLPKLYYVSKYFDSKENYQRITDMLDDIPQDASVTAPAFYVTPLANRDEIYESEYTDKTTQYIVFDLRYEAEREQELKLDRSLYKLVDRAENLVAVYKLKQ